MFADGHDTRGLNDAHTVHAQRTRAMRYGTRMLEFCSCSSSHRTVRLHTLTNNVFARRVIDQRFDGVAENCERFVDVYGLCARHALRAARTDALTACTRICIHYEYIIIYNTVK